MGALEIILLIAGVVIFIVSFLLPAKEEGSGINEEQAKRELHILAAQELQEMRESMAGTIEEVKDDAVEKAERSLERLTNEKIMAVNEYSDTVLEEIHKNHEEAMFLYDMLNSKHANIKDTVSKVDRAMKAAGADVAKTVEPKKTESRKPEEKRAEDKKSGDKKTGAQKANDTSQSIGEKKMQPALKPEGKQPAAAAQSGSSQNNNDRILQMHREGKSVVEIAKKLGLGVGEVQLVIDLYRE